MHLLRRNWSRSKRLISCASEVTCKLVGHENIEALESDQLTHVGGDAVIKENDLLEICIYRCFNGLKMTSESPTTRCFVNHGRCLRIGSG